MQTAPIAVRRPGGRKRKLDDHDISPQLDDFAFVEATQKIVESELPLGDAEEELQVASVAEGGGDATLVKAGPLPIQSLKIALLARSETWMQEHPVLAKNADIMPNLVDVMIMGIKKNLRNQKWILIFWKSKTCC